MGVRCESLEIDLSNDDAPFKVLDTVTIRLGLPSILVNNAAHSTRDGYKKLNAKILDDHYSVNMRATFLLCTELARRFEKIGKHGGRIVNMTSGQDISAFTLSLSAELAPIGITVNAVNPGPTDSGWMTEELKETLLPKFLLGRIGKPEDAARLVAFLASKEAGWITGQVIHSEGGFYRG
jgi:3-oxoacyl-[acyl-carrier protein] reductase